MADRALGLIEVKGYLGAVVAADAALKAANVSLLNIETVKAGLNTVDAAVELVQDKPYYLASHVISRLDNQTDLLFVPKRNSKTAKKEIASTAETILSEKIEEKPQPVKETKAEPAKKLEGETRTYTREELEKLKVVELRSLAYHQEGIRLSKKEIKFANKKLLGDTLMETIGEE